ncbi:MAG: hypothetical protein J5J04_17540 [Anaerolineae bacterium]|jgi:hypothetical protein|nr:hypothetical protein [Chloroflexota bacterium]MCO6445878.1 hypothetical protein [Anaerolineae bacterium]MDL1917044.1 hypothetical protein [Anaerolineae bacterium CFX4]
MDVFVAHTPLHLLYSLSIINSKSLQDFRLFVINDFSAGVAVCNEFAQVSSYADRVHLLAGRYSLGGFVARNISPTKSRIRYYGAKLGSMLAQYSAKSKFIRIMKEKQIQRLYIFDDQRLDTQSLMSYVKEQNDYPHTQIVLVEDGTGVYYNSPYWQFAELKNRLNWILVALYGKNYTRVDRYGDHPLVECSIVLFPDDVNVSLKSKPVYRMPHFHLAPEQASILSRAFSLGDQFAEIDQAVLLLLSYSETLKNHEKYKGFLLDLIERHNAEGITIIAKYHPREVHDDYLNLYGSKVIFEDKTVPAELICASLGNRLLAIYSDYSSALLTSGWINPDIKRIHLHPNTEDLARPQAALELDTLFEKHGVETVLISDLRTR